MTEAATATVSVDPLITPEMAMIELKQLQLIPPHEQTADQIRRGISLIRIVRRTTAGPAAAKTTKAKTAKYSEQNLDDLLKI